jgi:hypothetical protein
VRHNALQHSTTTVAASNHHTPTREIETMNAQATKTALKKAVREVKNLRTTDSVKKSEHNRCCRCCRCCRCH